MSKIIKIQFQLSVKQSEMLRKINESEILAPFEKNPNVFAKEALLTIMDMANGMLEQGVERITKFEVEGGKIAREESDDGSTEGI